MVPTLAVEEIAKVMTYGANKYGAHNWLNGIVYSRLTDALHRHLSAWENPYESDNDPDRPLPSSIRV